MGFKESLKMGDIGQTLYYQAHEGKLEKTDGFKSDFILLETGEGIELKTDYWSMSETTNFFMERYSNMNKMSPGGPWQAKNSGSTIFVYFYVRDLTFYTFKTDNLIEALEKVIPTLKPTDIQNKTYVTRGYRVPRSMLEDIAIKNELKVKIKDTK